MLKKLLFRLMVVVLTISFCPVIQTVSAGEKVYKLSLQANWLRSDPAFIALNSLVESAAKHSKGRLRISTFAEGEIVPFDQTLSSVKFGTVDMMNSAGVFWEGIIPVGSVEFGLPMSFNVLWEDTYERKAEALRDLLHKEGLADILRAEYAKHGHYWLDGVTSGPLVLLATKPLKTVKDWKGVKVGADGHNVQYYSALDARGVVMSPADVYMALKLGTIDARDWDIGAITGLNWHEAAPYWIQGMETYSIMNVTINLKTWNSMPKDIQAALTKACEDFFYGAMEIYKQEFAKADEIIKNGKLTVVQIDDAARRKFQAEADKIMDEVARGDKAADKAVKIIRNWKAKNSR